MLSFIEFLNESKIWYRNSLDDGIRVDKNNAKYSFTYKIEDDNKMHYYMKIGNGEYEEISEAKYKLALLGNPSEKKKHNTSDVSVTSEKTALNQIPSFYNPKNNFNLDNTVILDYGCGQGKGKDFCKTNYTNCTVYNFDPYQKNSDGNLKFNEIDKFEEDKSDRRKIICCNNVLNVIENDKDLISTILKILDIAKKQNVSQIVFSIYQGNKSGEGKYSKYDKNGNPICWQRNDTTKEYKEIIEKLYSSLSDKLTIKTKGDFVIVNLQ